MEKKNHNVFIYFVYSYLSDLKVTWIFAMPLIKAYSLIFAVPYKQKDLKKKKMKKTLIEIMIAAV